MDALPSVPEADATGETAALYADIRATLGVPATNLVWRHLAAIDGALGWVWGGLRTLYVEGRLVEPARRVLEAAAIPPLASFTTESLRGAGVSAEDVSTIDAVLENYHRSNPPNLVALMVLGAWLRGETGAPPAAAPGVPRPASATAAPLPALIAEADMSEAVRADARRLEALGTRLEPRPLIGGVPRHLAHWPGFLALAVTALAPFEGELARAARRAQAAAGEAARSLSPRFTPLANEATRDAIALAVARFTAPTLVANYIPKVQALRRALPEREQAL